MSAQERRPGLAGPKTNLEEATSRLIGRRAELAALLALLRRERLVTVLGPPGVGKTRLAKEYARQALSPVAALYPGGAWFCDLTEARGRDELYAAVGRALAVPLADAADAQKQLGAAL